MGLHLAGLAVLGSLAIREQGANRNRAALAVAGLGEGDDSAAAWLGVEAVDLSDVEIAPEDIPPDSTLPPTDLANHDLHPAALASGLAKERLAPAPDTGEGAGQKLQPAWRRDASTLRARLTDGSDFYQPSREDAASASSSPQALRREPIVGIGDSARTTLPRPTQAAPAADLPIKIDDDEEVVPPLAAQTLVPEPLGEQAAQGEGPLDAEKGATLLRCDGWRAHPGRSIRPRGLR